MNKEVLKFMRQMESDIELLKIVFIISIVVLHYFSFDLLPVFGPPLAMAVASGNTDICKH